MEYIYVNLLKRHGPNGILLPYDVDLTLRNTMSTDTPSHQHALMMELYLRTGGGVTITTGRSSKSVDKTLSGQFPGSFEHHAAVRFEQGGSVIALAPHLDTERVAKIATQFIGDQITIANDPDEVRQSEGKFGTVYPEVKEFAVALVHSLGHDTVKTDRDILIAAAKHAIKEMNLDATHTIAEGNDAIEIVPKGLNPNIRSQLQLNDNEIRRLTENGLNKGIGLHNFMSLPDYKDRVPYVTGDSGTDGKAMIVAQEYGGGGVWVKNGHRVPDTFKQAVNGREIENHLMSWPQIEAAVNFLRSKTKIIILPKDGPTLSGP